MRDDERYPTPVEEDPGLHPYTPEFSPGSAFSHDAISPTTVSPISRNLTTLTTSGSTLQKLEVEGNRKNRSPRQQCCGVRRRILISLVVGLVLLVIVGVVVGVVVALKLKEASEETTRLPALTSSGLFIGTNYTNWNSQIAYTNTTSGKVTFRLNSGAANFTAPQTMNLTIVPLISAPMSMVSMLGTDGNIYINLFYIYDSRIILANVSCDTTIVPTDCTTIYNDAISEDLSFPVYEYSGLAALYLGTPDLGFRVFYHNSDRYVTQLSMNGRGSWDHGATISGKAPSGSSISAAQVGNTSALTVLYVDDKSKDLYYISYNKTWEAGKRS
jgi:Fungal fucose-specific lectin